MAWVATSVLPHEAAVRAWLHKARVPPDEIDDLIQEAYCRLSTLNAFEQIARPGAYFFAVVRNMLARNLRRARVISIETIAEIEALPDLAAISPEQEVGVRLDAARIRKLISALPERCRRIVELRKIEGYSQREIAERLCISESIVENDIHQGVKAILRAWRTADERRRNGFARLSQMGNFERDPPKRRRDRVRGRAMGGAT